MTISVLPNVEVSRAAQTREQTSREATILLYALALYLMLQNIIKRAGPAILSQISRRGAKSTSPGQALPCPAA